MASKCFYDGIQAFSEKGGWEVGKVVGDEAEERPRMPFSMKVHITYESAIPCGARARAIFEGGRPGPRP